MSPSIPRRLLVSDFDGTMTRTDFYKVYRDRYLTPDAPDFWSAYRDGRISHFEALRRIFAFAAPGEPALRAITNAMGLDPDLPVSLRALEVGGWDVVVVSAGSRWYIDILLGQAGVDLEVHANEGRIEGGRLLMERPEGDPYPSEDVGIDKAAVVRSGLAEGRTVAFAGDGIPDAEAAELVPERLRFARGDLAGELDRRGLGYRPFDRWSEVAGALLADG